jgi:hypothetical protein
MSQFLRAGGRQKDRFGWLGINTYRHHLDPIFTIKKVTADSCQVITARGLRCFELRSAHFEGSCNLAAIGFIEGEYKEEK